MRAAHAYATRGGKIASGDAQSTREGSGDDSVPAQARMQHLSAAWRMRRECGAFLRGARYLPVCACAMPRVTFDVVRRQLQSKAAYRLVTIRYFTATDNHTCVRGNC